MSSLDRASLPLPMPSPSMRVVRNIQEPTELERVARGLVDVLEPVGAEVYPAEVARNDDEDVVDFLRLSISFRQRLGANRCSL